MLSTKILSLGGENLHHKNISTVSLSTSNHPKFHPNQPINIIFNPKTTHSLNNKAKQKYLKSLLIYQSSDYQKPRASLKKEKYHLPQETKHGPVENSASKSFSNCSTKLSNSTQGSHSGRHFSNHDLFSIHNTNSLPSSKYRCVSKSEAIAVHSCSYLSKSLGILDEVNVLRSTKNQHRHRPPNDLHTPATSKYTETNCKKWKINYSKYAEPNCKKWKINYSKYDEPNCNKWKINYHNGFSSSSNNYIPKLGQQKRSKINSSWLRQQRGILPSPPFHHLARFPPQELLAKHLKLRGLLKKAHNQNWDNSIINHQQSSTRNSSKKQHRKNMVTKSCIGESPLTNRLSSDLLKDDCSLKCRCPFYSAQQRGLLPSPPLRCLLQFPAQRSLQCHLKVRNSICSFCRYQRSLTDIAKAQCIGEIPLSRRPRTVANKKQKLKKPRPCSNCRPHLNHNSKQPSKESLQPTYMTRFSPPRPILKPQLLNQTARNLDTASNNSFNTQKKQLEYSKTSAHPCNRIINIPSTDNEVLQRLNCFLYNYRSNFASRRLKRKKRNQRAKIAPRMMKKEK